jgi:hypothetical protein
VDDPEPAQVAQDNSELSDGTKGVVRLLLAGHFKGVADVRLRINFYEELAAVQSQALQPVVLQSAVSVTDAVDAQIEVLVSSGELTEEQIGAVAELQQGFRDAADALAEEFTSSGDVEALKSGLQTAFDDLMAALRALLVPVDGEEPEAPPESVVELLEETVPEGAETPPAEGVELTDGSGGEEELGDTPTPGPDAAVAETPSVEDLLAGLEDAFASAVQNLSSSAASTSVLPPLSPPSGNGVAYAKFLAIYNELYGIGQAEAVAAEEPVGDEVSVPADEPVGEGDVPPDDPVGEGDVPPAEPVGEGDVPPDEPVGEGDVPTAQLLDVVA